jgi:hypothetical protein
MHINVFIFILNMIIIYFKYILNLNYINPWLCIVQNFLYFFFSEHSKIPKDKLLTLYISFIHVIEYYFYVN